MTMTKLVRFRFNGHENAGTRDLRLTFLKTLRIHQDSSNNYAQTNVFLKIQDMIHLHMNLVR